MVRNASRDLLEVLHVRTEDHGLAEHGGLEDVVAAVVGQAPADKHHGRHLIELRQLAERIEHDDVGARLGVDRELGSSRRDVPGLARDPLHLGEPFRLTRRQDHEHVRLRVLDPLERLQHGRLFAPHGAAGDDDGPARRDPEEPQQALARFAVRAARAGRRRRLERIELQAAGHGHPRRVRAEIDQTAGRLLALHAEAIDVGQHAAEERANQAVARVRPRRDAAVDDGGLHPALAAFAEQVGPDLGLHHDEEPRLHQAEGAAHDERPVERKVEHGVHDAAEAGLGDLLSRNGGRRQKEPQARVARLEIRRQRARRERLADRHGVNPDGLLAVEIERNRQVPEPIAQAADIFLVSNRLVHEVRRHDDKD